MTDARPSDRMSRIADAQGRRDAFRPGPAHAPVLHLRHAPGGVTVAGTATARLVFNGS